MTPFTLIAGTTTVDNTTSAVAVSAVTSTVWLPWLHLASDGAALIAPLLGTVWLIVQIVAKVRELLRKDKDK
ncbi:hypothetical protein X747_14450 [Mesorhizobium sp. LNJC384A00]|nr:hypothetical protein X755_15260 [Mesorhizobium sp. LNJC405B00]ESY42005.1 hypothetical protein X747_14450 [Mesorhizobium sp. LNJC384A00]